MSRAGVGVLVVGVMAAGLLSAPRANALRTGDLIGEIVTHEAAAEDTLVDVARRFNFGYVELLAANPGVDPWLIGEGTEIVLPGAHLLPEGSRTGIVVNLAEQRLYYFPASRAPVRSFPIGVGRSNWQTPTGETQVAGKREKPTWIPPPSVRAERPDLPAVVPPGPSNPLGDHALDLGWEGYVIHGTNRGAGIGRRLSYGCIRLYPHDIAWLFEEVPLGTSVRIIDQPVKLGWSGGQLYLEVHPTQSQADELEAGGRFTRQPIAELQWRVVKAAGTRAARLDWATVRRVAQERQGVPVRITR